MTEAENLWVERQSFGFNSCQQLRKHRCQSWLHSSISEPDHLLTARFPPKKRASELIAKQFYLFICLSCRRWWGFIGGGGEAYTWKLYFSVKENSHFLFVANYLWWKKLYFQKKTLFFFSSQNNIGNRNQANKPKNPLWKGSNRLLICMRKPDFPECPACGNPNLYHKIYNHQKLHLDFCRDSTKTHWSLSILSSSWDVRCCG